MKCKKCKMEYSKVDNINLCHPCYIQEKTKNSNALEEALERFRRYFLRMGCENTYWEIVENE